MIVCQSIVSEEVLAALMKVCRRWIEEMPTIAIASFTQQPAGAVAGDATG